VFTSPINFAGNEQALRGYLTNLRTRVRDDDARRMLDYIESYNSLVVKSHKQGGEIVDNLDTSVTLGGPGSPVDVHDVTYTRETIEIGRDTNNQKKTSSVDSFDSSSMLDNSLFTGQPLHCESSSAEQHISSRGLGQEPSTSKRFSSPHVPNIQKATNPAPVGGSYAIESESQTISKNRSVD
jgi:hypothetical protein